MIMMVMVMVMMMMVMMVMVLVMVMVMVMVPKALSQVGWLRQPQCQSINRLNPSIGQSFHKLRVQPAQRFLWTCNSCRSSAPSSVALKQALKQALE
jgi:biopolymer transport protein ExbB/TolQ